MAAVDRLREIADGALEASVVGSFTRVGYAARRAMFHWQPEPADLTDRVALVTGATSGIGLATAHALAGSGAEVWMVGRDATRLVAARDQIRAVTPAARLKTVVADLGVLEEVRACADTVKREAARLDVLVHNAGALSHELQVSGDGIELTAQVQVVAPFLPTTQLLPVLRATGDARVITVSSGGMYMQPLDLAELVAPRAPFNGTRAYANAKRAQVVLNEMWARRPVGDGIWFQAMHPGWADTAGVRVALPRFHAALRPLLRTPTEGADTVVWLAGAPEARAGNGGFWLDRRRRAVNRVPWTRTSDHAAGQLWDWCVARAGLEAELGISQ